MKLRHLAPGVFAIALANIAIVTATMPDRSAPAEIGASAPYTGSPIALPGTFQAEDFDNGGEGIAYHDNSSGNSGHAYRDTDVDVEASRDAGGGFNVGWVGAGEWVNYTVSVETTGIYTIEIRIASPSAGGTFHVEANDVDATGSIAVPNTGGWQTWTTLKRTNVTLVAGIQVVRLMMDGVAEATGAVGNVNWIRVTLNAASGSTPFTGSPIPLPGTIEAENFDHGGAEIAYHDTSTGNSGGAYRNTAVDLQIARDTGGGYNIGWVAAGEWLNYTVNVAQTGPYTIELRVASSGTGGTFHVEANGADKTGALEVPNTGGWQTWRTVQHSSVMLVAGTQVVRLVADAVGGTGAVGNVNWIRLTLNTAGGSTPFNGVPVPLPGTIEAEHFDHGGADIAYHDNSAGNSGGAYRYTAVDLQTTRDAGGGYNVGWVTAGEWLNYSASVATAGNYTIEVRVASSGAGGTFHIEANGTDTTGSIVVPNTGGWQTWRTVTVTGVPLAAGAQVLRLVADLAGSSGAVGNFNWIRVLSEQTDPLVLSAPVPGSTLRTVRVTFQWTGAGDEFWLNIGSSLGEDDVYASGSLGQSTEHTVNNLPLSGRTLYVEVRRRVGTATQGVHAQYTAPVRKALAVITDFSDRTLEMWTSAGMNDVADVSAELQKMKDHWEWLSRGREIMQWDITRIRLTQAAVPGAFYGWPQFRETVADLVKQQVDLADYDVNGDGVLDVSWSITSIGNMPLHWAIGGASKNNDVNMFVDSQASGAVLDSCTGCFNHEAGHLLGIVDMYGKYGTLGSLTVMAGTWEHPPNDFAPYERILLGWLTPRVVSETTQRIWLPPPAGQMAAVKVPTSWPSEYFLIEYRDRPDSGFGSAGLDHAGLVIYHVLEGSSMIEDPPLVKVEPADGRITPGVATDPYDLLYPGNPYWNPPMVLHSYFGEAAEVFRVNNVAFVDGGIAFDITMAPHQSPGLLANASFEYGDTSPDSWATGGYDSEPGAFVWSGSIAFTGSRSVQITSSIGTDRFWSQDVSALITGRKYLLCGWLRGEGISSNGGGGATISLMWSSIRTEIRDGTFDWTPGCVTFTASASSATVACQLGSASFAAGTLWCDDLSLRGVRSAFQVP
jgi:M6 family metalloprotease-like protein